MTNVELSLCLCSIICSSSSQIFIKSASIQIKIGKFLLLLSIAGILQLSAILFAVIALKTLQLSQLVPFAAAAYLLVPIGSSIVFKEQLLPRFWLGALFIIAGILYINY